MTYPLCDQTVTVYRQEGDCVTRRVIENTFYSYEDKLEKSRFSRHFLLILPGAEDIHPGDRVFDGIGPETVVWNSFLPVTVPGLSQVQYVKPISVGGILCHREAGRR